MVTYGTSYTIRFAAGVCIVCSVFVSGAAVLLRDRQEANKILDRRKNVLEVANLLGGQEKLTGPAINARFEERITGRIVHLETGRYADDLSPDTFDQQRAAKDPNSSRPAPENPAKVLRLPEHATVYLVKSGASLEMVILPIEGKGLWSTLYGYIAVDRDLETIRGITFYEHGETPGLGGEVDNPAWKGLWKGRKIYDASGTPVIRVVKGKAGDAAADPHRVDGISGATITSNGVTHTIQFWLGPHGFGPFLQKLREERGAS